MIIAEIINRKFTIDNPVKFAENKKENLILLINKTYANRCFNDGWIEKIGDVYDYDSQIFIQFNDNDCKGSMEVSFAIEKDSMISKSVIMAIVVKVEGDFLILECDRAQIQMPITDLHGKITVDLTVFKPGMILPVQVKNRIMPIAARKALVDGRLFIPSAKTYIFTPTGELSPNIELNKLITYGEKLQAELKKLETDKNFKFFKNYLYPKGTQADTVDRTKKQTIFNVARGVVAAEIIILDSQICWATDPCVIVDKSAAGYEGTHITFPLQSLLVKLLTDQILSAELLINLIKTYNTDELIKKHKDVFSYSQ